MLKETTAVELEGVTINVLGIEVKEKWNGISFLKVGDVLTNSKLLHYKGLSAKQQVWVSFLTLEIQDGAVRGSWTQ
jgi:hypothetical protein